MLLRATPSLFFPSTTSRPSAYGVHYDGGEFMAGVRWSIDDQLVPLPLLAALHVFEERRESLRTAWDRERRSYSIPNAAEQSKAYHKYPQDRIPVPIPPSSLTTGILRLQVEHDTKTQAVLRKIDDEEITALQGMVLEGQRHEFGIDTMLETMKRNQAELAELDKKEAREMYELTARLEAKLQRLQSRMERMKKK